MLLLFHSCAGLAMVLKTATAAVLLATMLACFGSTQKTDPIAKERSATSSTPAPSENEAPNGDAKANTKPGSSSSCSFPASSPKKLETMEDVVRLINALPKPVSVACLVQALPRPLAIYATANSQSGQPIVSRSTPRMFIFLGPSMTMNIVPVGLGARKVEFGFRLDNKLDSVKGELAFPVTENLALNAPFATILSEGRNGTECQICHGGEQNALDFGPIAFSSRINRPDPTHVVSLKELESLNSACAQEPKEECPIIQAIFSQGDVAARDFQ